MDIRVILKLIGRKALIEGFVGGFSAAWGAGMIYYRSSFSLGGMAIPYYLLASALVGAGIVLLIRYGRKIRVFFN